MDDQIDELTVKCTDRRSDKQTDGQINGLTEVQRSGEHLDRQRFHVLVRANQPVFCRKPKADIYYALDHLADIYPQTDSKTWGALVESMPFDWRVVGSNSTLAAT